MKLKNTLLAFPLQFPLMFALVFGVQFTDDELKTLSWTY